MISPPAQFVRTDSDTLESFSQLSSSPGRYEPLAEHEPCCLEDLQGLPHGPSCFNAPMKRTPTRAPNEVFLDYLIQQSANVSVKIETPAEDIHDKKEHFFFLW